MNFDNLHEALLFLIRVLLFACLLLLVVDSYTRHLKKEDENDSSSKPFPTIVLFFFTSKLVFHFKYGPSLFNE
jgi:hypothetical protein